MGVTRFPLPCKHKRMKHKAMSVTRHKNTSDGTSKQRRIEQRTNNSEEVQGDGAERENQMG